MMHLSLVHHEDAMMITCVLTPREDARNPSQSSSHTHTHTHPEPHPNSTLFVCSISASLPPSKGAGELCMRFASRGCLHSLLVCDISLHKCCSHPCTLSLLRILPSRGDKHTEQSQLGDATLEGPRIYSSFRGRGDILPVASQPGSHWGPGQGP